MNTRETIRYVKESGAARSIFDAEHFFDGYKANAEYAMAVAGGGTRRAGQGLSCALCDTNWRDDAR